MLCELLVTGGSLRFHRTELAECFQDFLERHIVVRNGLMIP